ncbi:MAG: hypothetical protein LBN24_06270 [Mediterranea sp.]|jgi:hypothetical protein|nr:hypothetical protein [Mediterranea sp.]
MKVIVYREHSVILDVNVKLIVDGTKEYSLKKGRNTVLELEKGIHTLTVKSFWYSGSLSASFDEEASVKVTRSIPDYYYLIGVGLLIPLFVLAYFFVVDLWIPCVLLAVFYIPLMLGSTIYRRKYFRLSKV